MDTDLMEAGPTLVFNTNPTIPSPFALSKTIINSVPLEEKPIDPEDDDPDLKHYVFDCQLNCEESMLAVSSSSNVIKIYDTTKDFMFSGQLKGHTDTITAIRFAHNHPSILFSSSNDGTIRLWDTRTYQPGPVFKGGNSFTFFDVDANDAYIAGSVNTNIYISDVRTTKRFKSLEDFHQDEITQVRFNNHNKGLLCSASVDGTVNLFDLSINNDDVDELLVGGINPEDSVNHINFFGPNSEFIYCCTGSERFNLWNVQGDRLKNFDDVRTLLSNESHTTHYMVDCQYETQSNQLYLFAGSFSGALYMVQVADNLQVIHQLNGGHSATIRSVCCGKQGNFIITGGEDSRICVWTQGNSNNNDMDLLFTKQPSPKRYLSHEKKPY